MDLRELTVIVPTRNEAHNVPAFLESLPPTVRLIVVDTSEDKTPELVEMLRPARTRVIRAAGPLSQARQIGAMAAQTEWLLFTDANVHFALDYFLRLAATRGHDALYGPKLSRNGWGWYYRSMASGQALAHALGTAAVSGSNLVVPRYAFEAVGGFDCSLRGNEGSELGWRLQRAGYGIQWRDDLIVFAHDHRQLRRGAPRRTLHTLGRCALLYADLMPERWRGADRGDGFWDEVERLASAHDW